MALFQLICMVALGFAYLAMIRAQRETAALAPLIFVASWIGEATSIHFYGFYAYSHQWWFRVAGVPLLIPLIWPLVILSGREVIRSLWPGAGRFEPLLVGLIVFVDASMVEAISVRCGLWSWIEPGYLGVPLIGVMGWAYFAFFVTLILRHARGAARLLVLAAPVPLHLMLVGSWWAAFRWILRGDWFLLFGALMIAAMIAVTKIRGERRIPLQVAGIRMVAAAIFVGYLLFTEPAAGRVWLHVLLVAVPYALATDFQR